MRSLFSQIANKLSKTSEDLNKSTPTSQIGSGTQFDVSRIAPNASVGANCYIYNSQIDEFSYLSAYVSVMNTHIGKFCSIARGVNICTGMHPSSDFVSTHPAFFSPSKQSGFSFTNKSHFREMGESAIGNDVWIGANAVIMDDINIGDGAIVGAGAIVTRDVPPYAIVAGSPAKVLRYRFEKEQIEFLMSFKWWNKDFTWLQENYLLFHDIGLFISNFKNDK